MSGGVVVLANLVVAATLIAGAAAYPVLHDVSRRTLLLAALPLAALPIATGALLSVYVFGEDSYRGNGVTRWEAYRSPGGALGPMFVLSVALMASFGALIVYAGLRGRARLFCSAALACGLASLVLVTATVIGFTAN
jgi:hypothetical protein